MKLDDFDWIDVHYHANPDLYQRRYNAIEIGQRYRDHNGLVVLKSHLGATSVQASIAQSLGLPVLPSLVLNDIAGGLSTKVVTQALLEYNAIIDARMIVHLPTITGCAKHKSTLKRAFGKPQYSQQALQPLTVSDSKGQLKPEIKELIAMASQEPIVLSTGHTSKAETYALIEACQKSNGCRLMLNQPANPMTDLKAGELLAIGQLDNVYCEQTLLTYLLGYQPLSDIKSVLQSVDNALYSSDLGQTSQMNLEEFVKSSEQLFKSCQLTAERVNQLTKTTPLKMLDLG